jgi:hypothetical protein
MSQNYKAVYFPDLRADGSKQKSLTLAFGNTWTHVYDSIKDLSSEEIRQLLGSDSYESIMTAAQTEDLPLNRYCLRQLKTALKSLRERNAQLAFAGTVRPQSLFDPVSATFKGGAREPFVRWYPYLQGYSPQFVEAILKRYAPDVRCLLDPFGGTGTTVFTAAQLGIKSYFCEINPVLQFICLSKLRVRQLCVVERTRLSGQLVEHRQKLAMLHHYERDARLHDSYESSFGNSEFFDEETYDQVLRIRSWIDHVMLQNPLVADLLTVAVLAALVPASMMKKAGDLRYKTAGEIGRETIPLAEGVDRAVTQMAHDITNDVNGLKVEPLLITENAHSLANIPPLGIDTVITSPPYVNGTNYFRNAKIELWFLRCLNSKDDLARYRLEALTTGINDVTVAKTRPVPNSEVEKVVSALKDSAYDPRIPVMIGNYFAEISEIFSHVCDHLTDGAIVAIDIGDSCYGGIHVPVDRLLSTSLRDLELLEKDVIDLRQRRSKGGAILKQTLMVYEYRPGEMRFHITGLLMPWRDRWDSFRANIPHQKAPYTKRNWGHSLHSLCSYPGKMKPAIAHHLVDIFVPEGGRLLDPFAGVGTIPFEGALQGRTSFGFEISPAAFAVASGKICERSPDGCREVIENLRTFIIDNRATEGEQEDSRRFGFNGKLVDYYHPATLNEIILARRFFRTQPPRTPDEFFVLASLLHILHGNRPYALSRRSHPITPYKPTGPIEYRSLITHLEEKVLRGLQEQIPPTFRPGKMFFQDATNWWPKEVNELDAVITSPPFFDSTRFYLANWIRLWFCGWDSDDFEGRPLGFMEERQKRGFDVYIPVLRQARERLKPHGVLVLHLGKSVKCDMAERLLVLGKRWFRFAELFDENVAHCESHGIRDKGTVSSHQYLVLY